jgi:hypothetical protein
MLSNRELIAVGTIQRHGRSLKGGDMKAPLDSNGSSNTVLVDGLSESWQEIDDGFMV